MKTIERVYIYLQSRSIRPTVFEKKIGFSNGYLSAMRRRNADMGESILRRITEYCQDISPHWLLTGEGEMLQQEIIKDPKDAEIIELLKFKIESLEKEIEKLKANK